MMSGRQLIFHNINTRTNELVPSPAFPVIQTSAEM